MWSVHTSNVVIVAHIQCDRVFVSNGNKRNVARIVIRSGGARPGVCRRGVVHNRYYRHHTFLHYCPPLACPPQRVSRLTSVSLGVTSRSAVRRGTLLANTLFGVVKLSLAAFTNRLTECTNSCDRSTCLSDGLVALCDTLCAPLRASRRERSD